MTLPCIIINLRNTYSYPLTPNPKINLRSHRENLGPRLASPALPGTTVEPSSSSNPGAMNPTPNPKGKSKGKGRGKNKGSDNGIPPGSTTKGKGKGKNKGAENTTTENEEQPQPKVKTAVQEAKKVFKPAIDMLCMHPEHVLHVKSSRFHNSKPRP